MAAELFPTGGDAVVKYVLEGHERGANWAAFHPTQSLIVSGADDRQVKLWRMSDSKAWEMDTLRGHTNNVSCVLFHPRHDLVISNSEDKSIRVWDVQKRACIQTYRREGDRFWMLAAHPEQNLLAAGHDGGMVVFKLERERPAACATGSGQLLYVRDRYLRQAALGTSRDVPLCALRTRATAVLGSAPRSLTLNTFNPGDDNVLITFAADGGSYELYTLGAGAAGGSGAASPASAAGSLAEPSRGTGSAAVFTARNKFTVLDRAARSLIVKGFAANDQGKRVKPPYPAADNLFASSTPGRVLVRAEDRICLFELQSRRVVAELAGVPVKYVVWSPDGSHVALLGKHAVVLADRELTQICSVSETVRVKGGAWDEHGVFLYATLNHIKYVLPTASGESGIVRTLEAPVYAVEARGGVLYALDRDTRVKAIAVDATEHTFKLALARKQYEKVLNIIRGARLCGQAVIAFLQKAGCPEVALLFVEDEGARFDLAIQCGNLDIALRAAKALNTEDVWLRLAGEALKQGALDVAEAAYATVRNFGRLALLFHITGATEKLEKMAAVAAARNDTQARFSTSLLTGNTLERVRALESAGQTALAYVAAAVGGLDEDAARLRGYLETANLPVPEIKSTYAPLAPMRPTAPLTTARLARELVPRTGGGGLDLAAISAAAAAIADSPADGSGKAVNGSDRAAAAASAAIAASAAANEAAAEEASRARVAARGGRASPSAANDDDGDDDDEEGGGWGDDDDLGLASPARGEGGGAGGGASGWGEDEDLGLDVEVSAKPSGAAARPPTTAATKAGGWVMPQGGESSASLWVTNSSLAADHASAGSFESAMNLLHRQIGVVNFAPLRAGFLNALLASRVSCPTLPGLPPASVAISRASLDAPPPRARTLPVPTVGPTNVRVLRERLGSLFSDGKFGDARDTADAIFAAVPLCVCDTKEEADAVKAAVTVAASYKLALRLISAAKTADPADGARQIELNAYATHVPIDPPHALLVLNQAMSAAFKFKNYIHAAGMARRLIEMPEAASAKNAALLTKVRGASNAASARAKIQKDSRPCPPPRPPFFTPQAKTVLQRAETEARNALSVNYDDRAAFSICAASLTPILKGTPSVRSPYSGAVYKPEFNGSVCVIDGMAQVGVETIGLVVNIATRAK